MVTHLAPKLALATVAAVALYVPTFGSPLPDSCTWAAGVAGAAPSPSPSCGGDLRECLRQSADMHQTTFGGRYVTAEDVSRCMEAFNACIHGGASRGGNAAPATSRPAVTASKDLPQHFRIAAGGGFVSDCTVSGQTVRCSVIQEDLPDSWESYSGTETGTLSGMTMTGTRTEHYKHVPNGTCYSTDDFSGPITYVFNPDGTAHVRVGPTDHRGALHGCGPNDTTESSTVPPTEFTATWSAAN